MEHTAQQAGRWAAPAATGPVRARLAVPGSKSMTNRALVLAALADGPGTIAGPLHARDTLLMRAALTALGATITEYGHYDPGAAGQAPSWQVTPGRPETGSSTHEPVSGRPGVTCQDGAWPAAPGS